MEQPPDRKRVQEFARKLFGYYTSGMLTLMVDIGHRTGLFEAAAMGAATSQQLADRAGLNERYVREWLGAMTTGGIVEYDASSRTFVLPAEHAVCLTGTSSRNLRREQPRTRHARQETGGRRYLFQERRGRTILRISTTRLRREDGETDQ
jgi:DNA-binding IclR family transcriptional regulator